jgi:hypothetical protein
MRSIGAFTPWFAARMTDGDRLLVDAMRAEGYEPRGHAASSRGPFTVRIFEVDRTYVGAGTSPTEALTRLAEKLPEQAA